MGGGIAVTRLSPSMASRANPVLDFIHAYFASHGPGPSLREMAAAIGAGKNRVQDAIRKLAREGRIHYEPGRPRGVWPPITDKPTRLENMPSGAALALASGSRKSSGRLSRKRGRCSTASSPISRSRNATYLRASSPRLSRPRRSAPFSASPNMIRGRCAQAACAARWSAMPRRSTRSSRGLRAPRHPHRPGRAGVGLHLRHGR